MTIPTIPKGKLVEHGAEPDKIHQAMLRESRVMENSLYSINDGWPQQIPPWKTNMTLENPHVQYESTSSNGGFSVAMSVFF